MRGGGPAGVPAHWIPTHGRSTRLGRTATLCTDLPRPPPVTGYLATTCWLPTSRRKHPRNDNVPLKENQGEVPLQESKQRVQHTRLSPNTGGGVTEAHRFWVLGHAPLPQLLHPLRDVAEVGVVVLGVFLCQVVDVPQGSVLQRREHFDGQAEVG